MLSCMFFLISCAVALPLQSMEHAGDSGLVGNSLDFLLLLWTFDYPFFLLRADLMLTWLNCVLVGGFKTVQVGRPLFDNGSCCNGGGISFFFTTVLGEIQPSFGSMQMLKPTVCGDEGSTDCSMERCGGRSSIVDSKKRWQVLF